MKKILYSIMALAISAFTLQSCEDVPAPYDIPGQGGNTDNPSVVEPKGDGTEANPYNIAAAIAATETLASGETTPNNLYIKGVVTNVKECSAQYGNATFYLGDDLSSTKTFYVYRAKGLNNQKIKADDEVMEGDTIIVCGPVTNYNGTIETVQNGAYICYNSRNGQGSGGTTTGDPKGDGTEANPYNLDGVKAAGTGTSVFVKGYIVGYISGKSFSDAVLGADTCTVMTNLLIASTPTETNKSNCMPVQLPTGVVRSGLNLKENKGHLGKEVLLCGNIEKYFGETGVKSVVYANVAGTEIGNKPGAGSTGEAKGDGTLANPFNSVAANKYAASLAAGVESDKDVYIKGKVVSVIDEFGTQYGNATFYISDDGKSTDQFYVYRTLYLGNQKYTGGDNIKAGDEVIICGRVTNYMGNTPETVVNKSFVYSLNGKSEGTGDNTGGDNTGGDNTGGDNTGGDNTGGDNTGGDGTTPDEGSLLSNGTFESWSGGLPVNWKTASTAGNATLKQSTDAHSGQYSVSVGYVTSSNKRLGYKETELEAGKYVFSFWAKATKGGNSQTRPGYVPVKNGTVGTYVYGDYANLTTGWTQVSYTFELSEKTTVCLVIMNPKNSNYSESQDILIDDAKLVKQ